MSGAAHRPALRREPLYHALVLALLAAGGIGVHLQYRARTLPSLSILPTINPNEAGVPVLMALPGLGPAKARAIVDYRNRLQANEHAAVFTQPSDLAAVPGIGSVTVQRLAPHLHFAPPSDTCVREKVLDLAADSIIMPGDSLTGLSPRQPD